MISLSAIGKSTETESIIEVTRGWGRRVGGATQGRNPEYRVSVGDDEKVLEMENVSGCKTLRKKLIFLKPLTMKCFQYASFN